MMAASQVERAAGAASDEEPPQAAEENGLYAAAIPAPAAAPRRKPGTGSIPGDRGGGRRRAGAVTITVREDAVWYNGEELSPEELEEALLRDGAPGVRLVDESADGTSTPRCSRCWSGWTSPCGRNKKR
jgi:hypothetical protein